MMNGLSLFFGGLLAVVAAAVVVDASQGERDPRRALGACLGLLVAVSTRNLLWIYVGFEVFSLAKAPLRVSTVVSSCVSLVGVVMVAVSTRASDLAVLEPTTSVCAGVLLFVSGLTLKWLQSRDMPFLSLGAAVALVSVVVRIAAWAPGIAEGLALVAWLVAVAAIIVGGVGAALGGSTRSLVFWLTMFTLGVAALGLAGGAPALPHVLMHVAASVVMLVLASSGARPVATWLAMLSLASVPPLPGFVTKLDLVASLDERSVAVVLVGVLFAALGCVRALARADADTADTDTDKRERSWVTFATLAAVVLFGLFPETLFTAATRAAIGLF